MKREGYTITDLANFYDFSHKKWSSRQGNKITRIIPHHMAGNLTPQAFYNIMHSSRSMSPTVAVFTDGTVYAYVPEEMRPWTTGSWEADKNALTLEIANDGLANTNWHISDTAYFKAVEIMARWCIQYGIEPVYTKRGNGINMHKDWSATACPGKYLENKIVSGQLETDIRSAIRVLTGQDKVEKFVTSLYKNILGRTPDTAGLDYWTSQLLDRTASARAVVHGFFDSPEYQKKKKTDTAFLTDCYKAILLRNPDATGKAYWLSELSKGRSRDSVVDGFVDSAEFQNFCKQYGIVR